MSTNQNRKPNMAPTGFAECRHMEHFTFCAYQKGRVTAN